MSKEFVFSFLYLEHRILKGNQDVIIDFEILCYKANLSWKVRWSSYFFHFGIATIITLIELQNKSSGRERESLYLNDFTSFIILYKFLTSSFRPPLHHCRPSYLYRASRGLFCREFCDVNLLLFWNPTSLQCELQSSIWHQFHEIAWISGRNRNRYLQILQNAIL